MDNPTPDKPTPRTVAEPRERQPPPTPRGVLPFRLVRTLAFGVISLGIFACGFAALMAVWDYADRDTAWKALTSLGIIAGTMVAFVVVNEVFGSSLEAGRSFNLNR